MRTLFNVAQPLYQMSDAAAGDPPEENQEKTSTGDEPKGKTFTQAEVDRMMADTRKDARKAVLKKAGYESEEDLIKATQAHKQAEAEKLSAAEKAEHERDDALAKADLAQKELQALRFERNFDKTVLKLTLEFQNQKARDVAFKLLDMEEAGKGEKEMEEAVKRLAEEHSYLFVEEKEVDIDAVRSTKGATKGAVRNETINEKKRSLAYHSI